MTAGYCHEDPRVVAERGTELVGWYIEQHLQCAIGPAQHHEVLHTLRLFGEQVIPHFQAKESRAAMAQQPA
jgi:hypothetical protein